MRSLAHDLTLTLRLLRARLGFVAAVVGVLGVALGASGVVAAVADRALLRPLPFDDPSRLVMLFEAGAGADRRLASYPTFLDWQRDARGFAGLGFARANVMVWRTAEGPERITAAFVSPGFLRVLGARPQLGRVFAPDEERAGDVVVLSDALWRRAFGADPAIVGRHVTFDDAVVTVVGVLPPGAGYPKWAELWRPIAAAVDHDPALASRHHHSDSRTIARLRPGVSLAAALGQLATVERRLASVYPEQGAAWVGADALPLAHEFVGETAAPLGALAGAAALVLLVASVNVATLLLLRAAARERELAVRAALGAGRSRLVRVMLLECLTLGAGAAALGIALAALALRLLRDAAPDAIPRAVELGLDVRTAALVLLLAAVATAVASAGPLLRTARAGEPSCVLGAGRRVAGGRGAGRARGALVVVQLALAVALLAGAGLLLESFRRLRRVDLGFDPSDVTTFWVAPPKGRYDQPAQAAALYRRLMDAVAAVPGVEGVAVVNHVPLGGGWIPTNVVVPGRPTAADGGDDALYKTVSLDYLRVLHIALKRGRWFDAGDMRGGGDGVVVNEAFARRYWPNADPVGRPVTVFRSSQSRPGFGDPEPSTVIGVVADVRHLSVTDDPAPEVLVPYTREVWPGITLVVRSPRAFARLEPALRRAVLTVEPDLPVRGGGVHTDGFHPLAAVVDANFTDRRVETTLLGAFAAVALGLAALGLYGVIAFGVAQRGRELAVRLAVGASPGDVRALVVGEGMRLIALGTFGGVAAALALARLLRALLFQTSPLAPAPFAAAVAVLAAAALLASWLPARRAARTDPALTLRDAA